MSTVGQLKSTGGEVGIEWEIANYLSLSQDVGDRYDSPKFSVYGSSWHFQLWPNGKKESYSEGYVDFFIFKSDPGPPMTVTCSAFLRKRNGEMVKLIDKVKLTFVHIWKGWGVREIIRRSKLIRSKDDYLRSGALTLILYLKSDETTPIGNAESGADVSQATVCHKVSEAAPNNKILSGVGKIRLSEDGCDVALQVKGQRFVVHRAVLRARSPVFAAMLRDDTEDKNTEPIDIEDCDPETFPDFLRFLYSGSAGTITPQNVHNLYRAAEKYQVQDLKSECLTFMKRKSQL